MLFVKVYKQDQEKFTFSYDLINPLDAIEEAHETLIIDYDINPSEYTFKVLTSEEYKQAIYMNDWNNISGDLQQIYKLVSPELFTNDMPTNLYELTQLKRVVNKRLAKEGFTTDCKRCNGTGKYYMSHSHYGNTCFKCEGVGQELIRLTKGNKQKIIEHFNQL
jgi:hypothetical protein